MNLKISSEKLHDWLTKAIKSNSDFQSIDIDWFYDASQNKASQIDNFEAGCVIFDMVGDFFNFSQIGKKSNRTAFLSINLTNLSSTLIPVPESVDEIVDSMEKFSVPELFIYKPTVDRNFPTNEFYRVPLKFGVFDFKNQVHVIYKQVRSTESMFQELEYDRELSFYLEFT